MTIYLYVKTHNKTGLKYLGMTTSDDPHKYTGSGTYWLRHLAVHGKDYTTEILRECHSLDELRNWGLHYSQLWNVADSDEWANLKEEGGSYGRHSLETRAKISANQQGKPRSPRPEAQRIQIAENNRKKANDPIFRAKLSASLQGHSVSLEARAKISESNRKRANDPNWISNQRQKSIDNGSKPPSQKGLPWWNNGISNKKQLECPGIEWKPGMIKRSKIKL
jgi:hypothetical protein